MTFDPKLMDKRIVRRMLDKGVLDTAEYEKSIAGLPDLTDKMSRLGDEAQDEDAGAPASAQADGPAQ